MIEMKPVKSSNVKATGYDPQTQTLAIQFGNGATYHYAGVPQDVYDDLCECESIGKFVATNIRGKFEFERQAEEKPEAA